MTTTQFFNWTLRLMAVSLLIAMWAATQLPVYIKENPIPWLIGVIPGIVGCYVVAKRKGDIRLSMAALTIGALGFGILAGIVNHLTRTVTASIVLYSATDLCIFTLFWNLGKIYNTTIKRWAIPIVVTALFLGRNLGGLPPVGAVIGTIVFVALCYCVIQRHEKIMVEQDYTWANIIDFPLRLMFMWVHLFWQRTKAKPLT